MSGALRRIGPWLRGIVALACYSASSFTAPELCFADEPIALVEEFDVGKSSGAEDLAENEVFETPEVPPVVSADDDWIRTDDELWFISSRCARREADGSVRLDVWRYDGPGGWRSTTVEELAAADPTRPVCFHVHGNRVNLSQANYGGWRFFATFTAGCCPRPALRFIIFSWPSDRLCGSSLDDVRAKAVRAECHAYYLASVVRRLAPSQQISMIGYSYGARLIGGALHLLGGGALRGNVLPQAADVEPRRIRAVLLAGALDDDFFLPGHCFQMAPSQLDRLLVTVNSKDCALKWYPMLYQFTLRRRTGQQAMGYAGLVGLGCLPQLSGRVEHWNVTCMVGDSHEWHGFEYLCGNLLARMRQYVFFEPLDACDRVSDEGAVYESANAPSPQ